MNRHANRAVSALLSIGSLILPAVATAVAPQDEGATARFTDRAQVNIINVDVVVTDGKGPPITALRATDFSDIDYETQEEIGEPSSRLIDVCNRVDADILVVGRRGSGLFRRMVVGSVANHVVHEAPCPVLVVP